MLQARCYFVTPRLRSRSGGDARRPVHRRKQRRYDGDGKEEDAVLDVMAEVAPNDRVVSIEDTTELQCSVPNHVDLLAVGNV